MMPRTCRSARWLAFAAVIFLVQTQAQAQVKPFKITGGGHVPLGLSLIPGVPAPHDSAGQATELGNHTGEGFFTLLKQTSPLTAEFSSAPRYEFTAANGDVLTMTYGDVNNPFNVTGKPGEVTLHPLNDGSVVAVFVAEFNPVPQLCTGRFAKLTGGSFIMVAVSDPFFIDFQTGWTTPFDYSWKGDGTLTFGKGR